MRKTLITSPDRATTPAGPWFDLSRMARVELTSEDPQAVIENALGYGEEGEWRAAGPGPQTIRLIFDDPQSIARIRLEFHEHAHRRTQEFALRWYGEDSAGGEIVRQQFTFSPPTTMVEMEKYQVALAGVRTLELVIVPDISDSDVCASLAQWRVA
jgi:hypothetical protein